MDIAPLMMERAGSQRFRYLMRHCRTSWNFYHRLSL